MSNFPNKKYDIIYADPPWKYNSRANHKTRFRGGASGHYHLMSMQEIKDLPVKEIASDDAVLFLWTTFPYLKEQLEVFESWGFKYKTLGFSWIKLNPKNKDPFFGVGYYTKSNCECCLLGTRGKVLKPAVNTISSVILAERQEHSKKPDQVRYKIDQMYPDKKKIELFARKKDILLDTWDYWGNEV